MGLIKEALLVTHTAASQALQILRTRYALKEICNVCVGEWEMETGSKNNNTIRLGSLPRCGELHGKKSIAPSFIKKRGKCTKKRRDGQKSNGE